MSSDPHSSPENSPETPESTEGGESRPRIKIGTQRSGVAPPRVEPRVKIASSEPPEPARPAPAVPDQPAASAAPPQSEQTAGASYASSDAPAAEPSAPSQGNQQRGDRPRGDQGRVDRPRRGRDGDRKRDDSIAMPPPRPASRVAVPNVRAELPPDLSQELEDALGEVSLEDLIENPEPSQVTKQLEPETRYTGRVSRVHRDNVFVELGGRNLGVVGLKNFEEPPAQGSAIDVMVARFNAEDGLYELTLPNAAVNVGDWSDITDGMVVDARVTGHNKGGLEVEVNHLRGFIPVSQVSLFRIEDLEQFVGQKLTCLVSEANPQRRNLVLSRRAILEREQAEAKQKTLAELEVGQVREGIVRNVRDFGAFVDLGGVDGMIHVSQMSWDRIKHPSEVLTVGQKVKVKIQKIDPDTHKISLAYRDLMESPWEGVTTKYPVTSTVTGTVSKIMDFGVFVRLEPGVEGLVHISELAHRRIFRASDVVSEGQQVEAKVISVDPEAQRISLSMKALEARPQTTKQAEPEPEEPETPLPPPKPRKTPLKGGRASDSEGERFGLKW